VCRRPHILKDKTSFKEGSRGFKEMKSANGTCSYMLSALTMLKWRDEATPQLIKLPFLPTPSSPPLRKTTTKPAPHNIAPQLPYSLLHLLTLSSLIPCKLPKQHLRQHGTELPSIPCYWPYFFRQPLPLPHRPRIPPGSDHCQSGTSHVRRGTSLSPPPLRLRTISSRTSTPMSSTTSNPAGPRFSTLACAPTA
jgi:hypothetical protein